MGNKVAKCESMYNPMSPVIEHASPPTADKKSAGSDLASSLQSATMNPSAPDTTSNVGPLLRSLEHNPGTVDELHRKCKDIFPICFYGGKFMVQKSLSNHFQINHTISLTPMSTGYRFGATFVGSKSYGPQDVFPVMLGDTDVAGNLTATIIHQFSERLRCKAAGQIQKNRFVGAQLSTDYRMPTATASLTMANLDLVSESGVVVGSYLRRVTQSLDMGVEMLYQYAKQIPGGQLSALSYLARYTGKNFVTSLAAGKHQLHLCYYHKQDDTTQYGVEWETNFRMGESTATFGCQMEIPKAGVTFKSSFDSNWTVASTLEKKLTPLPFSLALSGMLNHTKSQSRFGIGLIIG